MQRKNLWMLLSLLLSSILFSSCTNIEQIDKPVCTKIAPGRGGCTYLLSDIDFFVDDDNLFEGKTWFELEMEMVLVPPSTWASIKKYLLRNCKFASSKRMNCKKLEQQIKQVEANLKLYNPSSLTL